jgi:hypothetical protein
MNKDWDKLFDILRPKDPGAMTVFLEIKNEFVRLQQAEKELADRDDTIKHLTKKAESGVPTDMRGHYYNGQCPDACDMIDGPCACGAWHSAKEWVEKLNRRIKEQH